MTLIDSNGKIISTTSASMLAFLIALTMFLISILVLSWIVSINSEIYSIGDYIPYNYVSACDEYYGVDNWSTIGMDWINHDPKFVMEHGDLFYPLKDKNGGLHDYGCVKNGS